MGDLFSFDKYEGGLAILGLVMLLAAWIPQLFLKRHVTLPFLHLGVGYFLFSLLDLYPLNPFEEDNRWIWEKITEMAVIISLLGAGLKIDEPLNWKTWSPTIRLLAVTMPITIIGVYLFGWWVCGLPMASALLLGAILAPTDPVLAADIQVGPPQEGTEGNHVRFPLTSEAGLNDSLAFPFTYLAIGLAMYGWGDSSWMVEWVWKAVFYKIIVGAVVGVGLGYLLSKVIFKYPTEKPLAREGLGFIALSVLFMSYGGTELLGGYGFLAVFICAMRLRKAVSNHDYHNVLYEFSENVERSGMAIILFLLGALATVILPALDWYGILTAVILLFFIRPLAGFIGLLGTNKSFYDRAAISFFGIRGIGSVYYLAYAMGVASFEQSEWIWATVIFIIILSSVVHGILAVPVMRWLESENKAKNR